MVGRNGLTAKVEMRPVAEKGLQSRQKLTNTFTMKKIGLSLVIIISMVLSGQAQDKLKIGEMKNGKLIVTEPNALKAYFMNSLEKSGTLDKEYKVSYAPEGDRMLVYYHVTGNVDRVTNIGVMLVVEKNQAYIEEGTPESTPGGPGAGGSFEVQCFGTCLTCLPNVKWINGNWMPIVYCECVQGEGQCNMISKIVLQVNISL
jgi:hypothetical protein